MADQNSTTTTTTQQQQQNSSAEFDLAKLKNLNRVTSFPLIRQTLDFSLAAYARVKTITPLVEGTLTKVETISSSVLGNFKPVVERFDKQIVQADALFGQVVDRVERLVPAVKTLNPANAFNYTLERASELRTVTVGQIQSAKDFGVSTVAGVAEFPIVKAGFHALDAILHAIDNTVDTYLPAAANESTSDSSDTDSDIEHRNLNTLKKITNLTGKLRQRLTKFTVDKLHYVQRLYF